MTLDQRAEALAKKLERGGLASLAANRGEMIALIQNMAHAITDMSRRLSDLEGKRDDG